MKILITGKKKENKFLHKKAAKFDFVKYSKKDLKKLIKNMRQTMKKAEGVGLSANQVGLNESFFIAEMNNKFYNIFNPKFEKRSKETVELEEGCLSIPNTYGLVKRSEKITLSGYDINGKKIKIKAWGLLARIFQHEVDHLDGKLFTDK